MKFEEKNTVRFSGDCCKTKQKRSFLKLAFKKYIVMAIMAEFQALSK